MSQPNDPEKPFEKPLNGIDENTTDPLESDDDAPAELSELDDGTIYNPNI